MSKSIIVHLTDLHFNPLNKIPVACLDNYHAIVYDEFTELKIILQSYLKEGLDVRVCISGDIFNLKNQSLYSPKTIQYYSQLIEQIFENCTVYSIPGNHDLTASSMNLYHESAYNILVKSTSNMIDVSNKTININDTLSISGIPYYHLDEVKERIASFKLDSSKTNIMLLHSDIFKDSHEVDWYLEKFITFQEVVDMNPNISACLLGHIHKEMPITKINNTWFSKPHAFSRMTKEYISNASLMESYPSYAILTLENNIIQSIEYKRINKYTSSQFMDLNELQAIKDRSNKFNDFMAQINDTFGSVEESFSISNPDEVYNRLVIPSEIKLIIDKYIS